MTRETARDGCGSLKPRYNHGVKSVKEVATLAARVRRSGRLAWIAAAVAACGGSTASGSSGAGAQSAPLTTRQIVENSKPAIVRIESAGQSGAGVGTGFIVAADGRIATNLHVIHGAAEIRVTLLDGTQLPVQQVVAIDPQRDLAIIAIRVRQKLPTLRIGDSDDVSAGDRVIAIGNPLGVFDYTVSDGLISSVRPLNRATTILQISAPISQGSSGGPLFNDSGEVIGVATAIIGEGQNINFGIPSNYLRPMLERGLDGAISVAEFRRQLAEAAAAAGDGEGADGQPSQPGRRITRKVPQHPLSVLDGCPQASIDEAVEAIREAIDLGAPLYNAGNHEACYRIYEGTSVKLERDSACAGVRDALGQGLLRASTLETFTEKAWALRDAFDGMIDVVLRRQRAKP